MARIFGKLNLVRIGVWVWGTVLTLLFASVMLSFCTASLHVDKDGIWSSGGFISGLYTVIRTNQTVVAALIATLGVAWSWFFQMSYKDSSSEPDVRIQAADLISQAIRQLK
jgi:hypothetical protein